MTTDDLIRLVANEAQSLLNEAFARGTPAAASPLDQCGLRDGLAIVTEYIAAGEVGLALDHVRYMVNETGIELSPDALSILRRASDSLGSVAPNPAPESGG